jgi:hypothetical protein
MKKRPLARWSAVAFEMQVRARATSRSRQEVLDGFGLLAASTGVSLIYAVR